ncbi:MAG TPA: SprB repeat-containing protein [Saprospiraceae bacterium]|nr:SprB repeat-containing protein [Saprospiraceae bacterium]
MILIRYSLFTLLLCLLAAAKTAHAQCTTDAGTISGGGFHCVGETFSINNMGNETLDTNDILIFVAYTGAAPNASTVFVTTTDVNFPYQSSFLANSPFKVAAVAGNDAGGGTVDWNDPCLSVSPPLTVTYMAPPTVTVNPPPPLTCFNPSVPLICFPSQQNCTFNWTGPNNFTSNTQNPITFVPGQYCVTVTNQAGCTTTQCVNVVANIVLPNVSIAPPAPLTCANTSIILDASGSSQGSEFTYSWVGPGISPANQNVMNPTVNVQGTYGLIVTNISNGCTASTFVVVTQDAFNPLIIPGPDNGIPCGGGTATLNAGVQGGGQYTYNWSGPGIVSGAFTLTPVVNLPGIYTLVVTNSVNGCTSTDDVTVFPGPAIPQQDFAIGNIQCSGQSNGSINTTFSVGQAPFTVQWSGPNGFTSTAEDIGNLAAGQYSITATDNTGCTYYANVLVEGPASPITATFTTANASCSGNDGVIIINVTGGTPPYLFAWSTGATGPVTQGLTPGLYFVTITDAFGCTLAMPPITIVQAPTFSLVINELSNTCSEAAIQAQATGGAPPYTYFWTGPNGFTSTTQTVITQFPGLYNVTVWDAFGCSQSITYSIQLAGGNCGYLSGYVIRDTSQNCFSDAGEPALAGWLVRADGATDTIYGVTNSAGKYFISVPLGDYTVSAIKPNNLWELCPPGALVSVNVAGDTFPGSDIPVKKLFGCPALSVSIGTNQLRRCFSNNYYYVDYCNDGTEAAEDAYIILTLDPFLSPLWSSLPYTISGNNVLRFDVGDLDIGECGTFSLQVQVSCNAALGQTHCTEAHIYPDSTCFPNDPSWSGASLKVNSQCDADSVRFTVKNIGQGDMTGTVDYVIIEDAVMLMLAPLQPLDAGDSVILSFPANGSTWRLEVDQVAFHPGISMPSLSVEGCSANPAFSTGFVTQFAVNDADPWVDIDCTANTGSYDPNDKQGFPVGYGAAHYIRLGTELEYLIRFQNTGTDTAFTVRVVDTLSAWLDPATIRPGASSHPYQFNLSGSGIAEFLFENILLPDSNVNQAASNGFVKFSILHRADAPLETVIENDAAIYFDFNDPVITNTTFHRLGENFVLRAWHPIVPGAEVSVAPNPLSEEAILTVKGLRNNAPLRLRVLDQQGVVVSEMETPGAVFNLKRGHWPAGVYLFQVFQDGKLIGSGKLAVQ